LAELDDVVRLTNQRKELPGPSQEVDTSDSESSTELSSNSGSEGTPRKKKTRRGRKKTKKMADTGPELTIASVTSSINMIGAAPFAFLSKQKGAQVFSVSMNDIMAEKGKQAEKRAEESRGPKVSEEALLKLIPEEYRDLAEVFSKKAADTLPEHGPSDHHITLDKEAEASQLGHAPLYRMSQEELDLCKEFINENLNKGFIEASQAPYASPVLFVRKPGGGLRFCVDYRKLNAMTKKDAYPLPLIEETLAQITGAKILTKIDIRHAFNRIRMATPEDEDLTTFKTRFGSYKSKVLPFGLCNGPATFQHHMNEVLWEGLNEYLSVYMDDILVYSQNRAEHVLHVRSVLERLKAAGLQADIKKCEFFVKETKFLGLIVGVDGIKMDPEKVKAIVEWQQPRDASGVRAFLGFGNFYRRFIRNYSKIVRSLVELTKKDFKFEWTSSCQTAFDALKQAVVSAPILRHFDRCKTCYVECDASDYVTAGVLSQKDDEGILHPVAFFSRKMAPAECNYEIYDKELLAIIRCFEEWRPDLEGSELPIQVLTDHKSLEYFMSTKRLTRRQARWAEFLAGYNFQITYRPGKDNQKADSLTRRPGDRPEGDEDHRQKEMIRTILTPDKIHPDVRCELQISYMDDDDEGGPEGDQEEDPLKGSVRESLRDKLLRAQAEDKECQAIKKSLEKEARLLAGVSLAHCDIYRGLIRYRQKVWIPESMRTWICKEHHDQPMVGHAGIAKTLALLKRQYYWPRMDVTVTRYVGNCHPCRRAKPFNDSYNGVLIPLPIPQQPWQDISMDFITGLPMSGGYDAVLVVTCRLTKMRHFIPCLAKKKGTSSYRTAELIIQHVVKLHGLPDTIVSDRGPQFVAEFWKHLCRILEVDSRLSTAYHPETDGQTEVENRELEKYLRIYVKYQQDDWAQWLALAEFAANNAESSTTKASPFFANLGYNPRLSFDLRSKGTDPPKNPKEKADRKLAVDKAKALKALWEKLRDEVGLAQSRMERFANEHRRPAPAYRVGDMVWLSAKNLRTQRPSVKLDHKNEGPYKVLEKVGATSYRLDIPEETRIHPVFHSNLLRLDREDPLPGQIQPPPGPVIIDEDEGDEEEAEWEVKRLIDSRIHKTKGLQYRADWVGWPPDKKWYPAKNFENAPEVRNEFHAAYPNKPGS
jgi:RNase H-like domain found in reverse transcriptase/Reverse transcriptase (RNA-dependent DNA polymerase)/Integrase zinc binding domain